MKCKARCLLLKKATSFEVYKCIKDASVHFYLHLMIRMVRGKHAFIILPESRTGLLLSTGTSGASQRKKPLEASPAAPYSRRRREAELGGGRDARVSTTPKGKGIMG